MTIKKGACKRNEPGKRIRKGYIFIEDNICHLYNLAMQHCTLIQSGNEKNKRKANGHERGNVQSIH